MNINLHPVIYFLQKNLSVGGVFQNILFYSVVLMLLYINMKLIRRNNRSSAEKITAPSREDQTKPISGENQTCLTGIRDLERTNKGLCLEISFLKKNLLDLGKELELSYLKSDRLSDQLDDFVNSLEIKTEYDGHIWDWSLDFTNKEFTFSDFGLKIHGFSKGLKLPLQQWLALIDVTDRSRVADAVICSQKNSNELFAQYKLHPRGVDCPVWIKLVGDISFSVEGIPEGLSGKFTVIYHQPVIYKP